MVFSEDPKMSESEWVADPKDPNNWIATQARPHAGSRIVGHGR